jgi:hypothetical protein
VIAQARARAPIAVEVGVLGVAASAAKGDVTVGDIATWAEFGIGQPQRSWLGGWIDEHEKDLDPIISAELRAILKGDRTREQAAARLGAWIVGSIQQRIADGIDPPNAESTIRQKGSATPLIDTGQLRSSIASRVVK